jgi:two-component system sensor histidine kinase BaeS
LNVATGQPLATRLALVLAGVVLVVLLVAGVVVNGVVNRSFQDQLTAQQQRRVDDAAALIGSLPAGRLQRAVMLLAPAAGGQVSVLDASGAVIASAGRQPAGPVARVEQTVAGNGPAATLVLELPQRALAAADRAFLRVFNIVLIGVGVASVLVLIVAAGLVSNRLTRPLRAVTDAARRLGAGDLGARASGGPDRESHELAAAFNAMAERLQQSETLRRRAASDMAHDLATPATVLESQLQAMVDGIIPTDRQQLESARASAGALGGVVARLGELIEAESAPLARRPERVRVAALVGETQAALAGLFRERSVAFSADVPAALAVTADRAQIGRALRNVLGNAAEHGGGSVRLVASEGAAEVLIRVSDSGPGISDADLPYVFERFYRADPARRRPEGGSGIGLTIARELLAANGGAISAERSGPDGTTFLIRLPQ